MVGFGISLFLAAETGADTLTVFLDGVNRHFGIPASLTNQVVVGIILILAILLNREAVGLTTIVYVLTIGTGMELSSRIIAHWQLGGRAFAVRFAAIVAAQLLMAAGYGWMQTFASGMMSIDAFLYGIVNRWKVPYIAARGIFDLTFFISGWALGGIIGIGTVFSVLTMGTFTSIMKQGIMNFQEKIKKRKEGYDHG